MADCIEGVTERIRKEYRTEAEEMERTVATCETCTFGLFTCLRSEHKPKDCMFFIPIRWRSHIYFNGEWWS